MNNIVNKCVNKYVARFALLTGMALGHGGVMAAVPEVNLATGPLFGGIGNVHPNLILDLSVEFPTVGAAYRGASDYAKTGTYLGYFNPLMCYTYPVTTVAAIPYPDLTDATGFFSIFKTADANHECGGDSFSGNFMNWASSSSIDMLRYAISGGDRFIDTASTTVLQRAYLYEDPSLTPVATFYAHGNFPRRVVTASASMSAPNQVTPFNVPTLYIVSCRNRILFSNTNAGGTCTTARTTGTPATLVTSDKYLGEYLTRVKVCDSVEGPTRNDIVGLPNFCKKYGSNYKPEGNAQIYSDKIRVGAFGYLTGTAINSTTLYGGVLRGRAKYLGPKQFTAPAFSESANDLPEWDASTGVFYNNPENASDRNGTTNSGVINYLNKFGRTNTAALGRYKRYDTISELYYESIRYLQGKQPTAEAISALGSNTTDDNFPVLKTWADPVTASCQSNYIVTIGDVNTHYDRFIPGNTRVLYGDAARAADAVVTGLTPALDVMTQSKLVGNLEADVGGIYGNSAPRTNLANLDTMNTGAGGNFTGSSGNGTYYMAGLAYWANTNAIRIDKPVRVKTFSIDVDEGGNGSIEDTSTRNTKSRNSQFYLAAKYGGFNDVNKDGNPFKTTAGLSTAVLTNNSEWASNGTDPDNYFLANNPTKIIKAINTIFKKAASASGTISGVSLNASKITPASSYVYQPGFDSSKWSGGLLKLEVKLVDLNAANVLLPGYVPNNVVSIQDAACPTWDAGVVLTGTAAATLCGVAVPAAVASPAPADRAIYTAKVEVSGALTTVPFKWTSLNTGQQALLDQSPVTPFAADGLGLKRVDYLRGSRVEEGSGPFRARDSVLGDIINSNPIYVAAPSTSIQGDNYKTFYDAKLNRKKTVYVGANDGMLHAFDAADGKELFAYIPNALIGGLNKLTDPSYVHQPYVDGTMTVNEALVAGTWKTILVSGMGAGGQGVFVLNVTDPDTIKGGTATDLAIWEFTDKDDADMGNIVGQPLVAKFKTAVSGTGVPTYKYFVVVPGGLNSYKGDPLNSTACTGGVCEGALFLLSLDKAAADPWVLGSNYYKFKTTLSDGTLQNGLSTPALVASDDGSVKFAYAGDLQGNLWRFNFTGAAPWSSARSSVPVFTAKNGAGDRQPITHQPRVVFAPGGGYVVLFGSGKYVETADATPTNFKTQSFYGVYDTTNETPAITVDRSTQLEKRTLAAYTTGGVDAVTITGNSFSYGLTSPAKRGWYFDYLNSSTTGERSVTNALVTYGKLFVNSLVTGTDPCVAGGGRTYSMDALTGLPINASGDSTNGGVTGYTSTVGMLSSPVLFETGTSSGDRDSVGKRATKKEYSVFNFGTGGANATGGTTRTEAVKNGTGAFIPPDGRISWREVLNYQELFNKANP